MEQPKTSEMPFGTAVLFTLIGIVLSILYVTAWVGPTLVRYAVEREADCEVRETRPKRWTKPPVFGLEARVAFTVEGRLFEPWVVLPLTTREKEGAEAEAVRSQAKVGQRLRCYYDPRNPGVYVATERIQLGWSMLWASAFGATFLLAGIAGLVTSWDRTFPRGLRAEVGEVGRRLPWSFHAYVAAAALAGSAFFWAEGVLPDPLRPLGALGPIALTAALVYRAVRVGKVAWPSPERLAALGREAGHPAAGALAKPRMIEPWAAPPAAVSGGQQLAVRLAPGSGTEFPATSIRPIALLPIWVVLILVFVGVRYGATRLGAGASMTVLAAFAFALIAFVGWRTISSWDGRLTVEVSDHPFHAGGRYQVSVSHPVPARIEGLRVELSRTEEATPGPERGGKKSSRSTTTQGEVVWEELSSGPEGAVRKGHLDIPEAAVPSLALKHHWVDWSLVVRPRGRLAYYRTFPVTVGPAEPRATRSEEPAAPGSAPSGLGTGPAELWLHGGPFDPGELLSGGYSVDPVDGRRLESVELSVFWETDGPGGKDLGVCHYDDRAADDGDDLALYVTRAFAVPLPDGPPTFQASNVKLHWQVRLRLRYADGGEVLREAPFVLGRAES
jgi:hypothetical protein